MKRVINIVPDSLEIFNASSKPREDINRALNEIGFEVVNIIGEKSKVKRFVTIILKSIIEVCKIRKHKDNLVVCQYPIDLRPSTRKLILRIFGFVNTIYLIHDIGSLRFDGEISKSDIQELQLAKKLIVHTSAMQKYLFEAGVTTPMEKLWLFDYYYDKSCLYEPKQSYNIVFAGNLNKSQFIKKIGNVLSPYKLLLYGKELIYEVPKSILYKGCFNPNDLSNVEGDWGLVWDGDSITECNGRLGEYLRYNSAHKVSLYLSCGKPVIVWSKSALGQYLVDNNLGISVDSLDQIPEKLNSVSLVQFNSMIEAVKVYKDKLSQGFMIKEVLKNILNNALQ